MKNNKTLLIIPLPQYGHIIPTIKLARRFCQDGWEVVYSVDKRFAWLQELGFSTYIVDYDDNYGSSIDDFIYLTNCIENFLDIIRPDAVLTDIYVTVFVLPSLKLDIPISTYQTCADVERTDSLPLTSFGGVVEGLGSRWVWFFKIYLYRFVRQLLSAKQRTIKKIILDKFNKRGFRPSCSSITAYSVEVEPFVLGPMALSDKHLEVDRYFGFCVENDRKLGASDFENWSGYGEYQQSFVTYCSFGSMNHRYKDAESILLNIITIFNHYGLGRLVLQAGCYYEKFKRFESENVKIYHMLEQKSVLKHANIAIIHGGFGSVKECTSQNVPMLVIPFYNDQFGNARKVREMGLGESLHYRQATAENLLAALQRLKRVDGYQSQISQVYAPKSDEQEFERAYHKMLSLFETWKSEVAVE